jgi:RNA polymerase sigma factor (sigma-70 family)
VATSPEIVELIDLCRRGDPVALAELVRRYKPVVRRAVRSRLPSAMRGRFDSIDFAQDVWASFFRVNLDRADLDDETALVAYLAQMARIKVTEEFRYQTTLKVGLRREHPLRGAEDLVDDGPSPSAEVIARDRWEWLTAGLNEQEKRMLVMVYEGHTQAAIAAEFGLTVRTVRRLVERVHNGRMDTSGGGS